MERGKPILQRMPCPSVITGVHWRSDNTEVSVGSQLERGSGSHSHEDAFSPCKTVSCSHSTLEPLKQNDQSACMWEGGCHG